MGPEMLDHEAVKKTVYETAVDLAARGPGWAQERAVLREAAERLGGLIGNGLPAQQAILSAWHDLFLERKLGWGYNIDNPNSPFFHVRQRPIQDPRYVMA